jgi:glycosyltransferase involved in cell wall biosynthesis
LKLDRSHQQPLLNSSAAPSDGYCALSVVVPTFNEELALPAFHARLLAVLRGLAESWEIIYVDDGSEDKTSEVLSAMQTAEPSVGVARFSRNFGKENALTAGLRLARGAAVVLIDADLQHPPEEIPAMLTAMYDGADVVSMRRKTRVGETSIKRLGATWFYRALNRLSEVPIRDGVGDFRLLSRRAVDALNQLDERCRFMKGLFSWIGFRETTLDYDVAPRAAGETKWRYRQLWRFAIEGLTSFSIVPLKLASYAGLASALAAFAYAVTFAVATLLVGEPVKGFPTLIITILLIGGLQLMATGILGEYLGRLFIETKRRPLYVLETYRAATPQRTSMAPQEPPGGH